MPKRKAVSKKLRFEVFKRDKFTCQYCGDSAPDVVLHVDHIIPVSKGGLTELVNLITSCQPCNSGKKNTLLSDETAIKKQKKQLDQIQERREQIEELAKWRHELSKQADYVLDFIVGQVNAKIHPTHEVSEVGLKKIRTACKKYDPKIILQSIDVCEEQYLQWVDSDTVHKFINMIPRICEHLKNGIDPKLGSQAAYLAGIAKNRVELTYSDLAHVRAGFYTILKEGYSFNTLKERAMQIEDLDDLVGMLP